MKERAGIYLEQLRMQKSELGVKERQGKPTRKIIKTKGRFGPKHEGIRFQKVLESERNRV